MFTARAVVEKQQISGNISAIRIYTYCPALATRAPPFVNARRVTFLIRSEKTIIYQQLIWKAESWSWSSKINERGRNARSAKISATPRCQQRQAGLLINTLIQVVDGKLSTAPHLTRVIGRRGRKIGVQNPFAGLSGAVYFLASLLGTPKDPTIKAENLKLARRQYY